MLLEGMGAEICSDDRRFLNFEALAALDGEQAAPAVLVFGGSTFMGRELVQRLVARPARVCVVNRGRKYWGTDDPSGGHAARLIADRRDASSFAGLLDEATKRLGTSWDLVADFSAYNGNDMRAALAGLRGRFRRYAYISSDSVYEVSAWAGDGWLQRKAISEEPYVAEAESERPSSKKVRHRLQKADSYGDGKLEAEEALAAGLLEVPGCRGVSLRLPDVIGPFDDTGRLWAYWHWLHAGPEDPPQVPDTRGTKRPWRIVDEATPQPAAGAEEAAPLSFVFSRDVARFIAGLLDVLATKDTPVHDAVNLACEQQPDLRKFLEIFAKAAGLEKPPPVAVCKRHKSFLPSVDRPWKLSCDHMLRGYSFAPTPLPEVLEISAAWFKQACSEFPQDALRAAGKLPPKARKKAIQQAGLEHVQGSSSSSSSSGSNNS